MSHTLNEHIAGLEQSAIRAISLRCKELNGINLGQGICDNPVHPAIKEAAIAAINNDNNTYVAMKGIPELREQVATKARDFNHIPCQASNILISHGATGAFVGATKALFNPGDEIIVFEPFYGYHKGLLELFHLSVKSVPLQGDDFNFDVQQLRDAITEKTRAIAICNPCNPCGKVFSEQELRSIGDIACEKNLLILSDEMYEYITFDNHQHISIASLSDDYFQRTITISGFSKTYSITGWRMGYLIASEQLVDKIALANDLFYICPATPFQHACVTALQLPQSYYDNLRTQYSKKRELFLTGLKDLGFKFIQPNGAYYVLADFSESALAKTDDPAMALLEDTTVAAVDGQAFFSDPNKGKSLLRFCFASSEEKLEKALTLLSQSSLLAST